MAGIAENITNSVKLKLKLRLSLAIWGKFNEKKIYPMGHVKKNWIFSNFRGEGVYKFWNLWIRD